MAGFSLRRPFRITGPSVVLAFLVLMAVTPIASAGHQGAKVIHGNVVFSHRGDLFIIRASDNAIINYTSFSIGRHETVRFIQPNELSRVLNRISGTDPTRIDGRLMANGIVYLVNPAGVIFGNGSVVDVGGIYAAGADLSNTRFFNNINRFTNVNGPVENNGTIQADAVNLIGAYVANRGTIISDRGLVTMIAGDDVLISEQNGRIYVRIDGREITQADRPTDGETAPDVLATPGVENTGLIDANRGQVVVGAGDMYSLAVHNDGIIRAARGEITVAALDGTIHNTGRINVSAEQGAAGSIVVQGPSVVNEGKITADSHNGAAGSIEVTSQNHTFLSNGSLISAAGGRGEARGGDVLVHSYNGVTYFAEGATIDASGGRLGGNAGAVEVSGKSLSYAGHVNLNAARGALDGSLLIDPWDIYVDDLLAPSDVVFNGTVNFDFGAADPENLFLLSSSLEAVLGNITLQALNDIFINSSVTLFRHHVGDDHNVTLEAVRNITFNAPITGIRDLTARADADNNGVGTLFVHVPLSIGRDAVLSGAAIDIGQNFSTGRNLTTNGPATVVGDLSAGVTATFNGAMNVTGNVTAGSAVGATVTFKNTANVTGNVTAIGLGSEVIFKDVSHLSGDVTAGFQVTFDKDVFFDRVGGRQTVTAGDGRLWAKGDVRRTGAGSLKLSAANLQGIRLDGNSSTVNGDLELVGNVEFLNNAGAQTAEAGGAGSLIAHNDLHKTKNKLTLKAGDTIKLSGNVRNSDGTLKLDGNVELNGASDQELEALRDTVAEAKLCVTGNLQKTTDHDLILHGDDGIKLGGEITSTTGGRLVLENDTKMTRDGDQTLSAGTSATEPLTLRGELFAQQKLTKTTNGDLITFADELVNLNGVTNVANHYRSTGGRFQNLDAITARTIRIEHDRHVMIQGNLTATENELVLHSDRNGDSIVFFRDLTFAPNVVLKSNSMKFTAGNESVPGGLAKVVLNGFGFGPFFEGALANTSPEQFWWSQDGAILIADAPLLTQFRGPVGNEIDQMDYRVQSFNETIHFTDLSKFAGSDLSLLAGIDVILGDGFGATSLYGLHATADGLETGLGLIRIRTNIQTEFDQEYSSQVQIEADNVTLTSGHDIIFHKAVLADIAGFRNLTVDAGHENIFGGPVGIAGDPAHWLKALTATGKSIVSGDIFTSAGLTFNDDVELNGTSLAPLNQTLDAGAGSLIALGNVEKISDGSLTLAGDAGIELSGLINSTSNGNLVLDNDTKLKVIGSQTLRAGGDESKLIAKGDLEKTQAGNLTLEADGGIELQKAGDQELKVTGPTSQLIVKNDLTKTQNGSLTLTAPGDIVLGGDVITTDGDLVLNNNANLNGEDIDQLLKAGGAGKSLIARKNLKKTEDGKLTLEADGQIQLGGVETSTSGGSLVMNGAVNFNRLNANQIASATGGKLEILADADKTTNGDLNLHGAQGIRIAGSPSTTNGKLIFENHAVFTDTTDQTATADNGELRFEDGAEKASGGSLTLQGANGINVTNGSSVRVLAGGSVLFANDAFVSGDVFASLNVTFEGTSKVEGIGGVRAVGGNAWFQKDAVVFHDVRAGNDVQFDGKATIGTDTITGNVTADGNDIKFGDGLGNDAAVVHGSVNAKKNVTFNDTANVDDDVTAETGDALFVKAATVGGDVLALHNVTFQDTSDVTGDVEATENNARFKREANIGGNVTAGQSAVFNETDGNATVHGSVHATNNVAFKHDATVDGNVNADTGSVQFDGSADIGGDVTAKTNVTFEGTSDVEGDVEAIQGEARFKKQTNINGDVRAGTDAVFNQLDGESFIGGDVFGLTITFNEKVTFDGNGQQTVRATNGTLLAHKLLTKTSDGNLVLGGSAGITLSDDVNTSNGDLTLENNTTLNSIGNQEIEAGGAGSKLKALANVNKTAAGQLTLTGAGGIELGGAETSTSNGDLVLNNDVTLNEAIDQEIKAGGATSKLKAFGNVQKTEDGKLTLTAPNGIELGGAITSTSNGDLVLNNDTTLNGNIDQEIKADGATSKLKALGYVKKVVDGKLTLTASGGIELGGAETSTSNGDLVLNNNVNLNKNINQELKAGSTGLPLHQLIAKGDVKKIQDGQLALTAQGGIVLAGSETSTSNGDLVLNNDVTLDQDGNQLIKAGGATAKVKAAGDVKKVEDGNLTLAALGGIELSGAETSTSGGDLVLQNNVNLNKPNADQLVVARGGKLDIQTDLDKTTIGNLNLHGDSGIEIAGSPSTFQGDMVFENFTSFDGDGNQTAHATGGKLQFDAGALKETGNLTLMGDNNIDVIGSVNVIDGSVEFVNDSFITGDVFASLNVTFDEETAFTGAALQKVIAGAGTLLARKTFTKTGAGDLELSGGTNIDLDDDVAVQQGSLTIKDKFNAAADLTASQNITLDKAGTLDGVLAQEINAGAKLHAKDTLTKTGAGDLTLIGTTGGIQLDGAVKVQQGSLTVVDALQFNGSTIDTSANQSYLKGVTLGNDSTLTSTGDGSVHFFDTINVLLGGNHELNIDTAGLTQFDKAVSVGSLHTLGGGNTLINGGLVTTFEDQWYQDNVFLGATTVMTVDEPNFAVIFDGTLNSQANELFNLNINAANTFFNNTVGNNDGGRLGTLTTDAAGFTTIDTDSIKATNLNFLDQVKIAQSTTLNVTNLTRFADEVYGDTPNPTQTLTINSDVTRFGGNVYDLKSLIITGNIISGDALNLSVTDLIDLRANTVTSSGSMTLTAAEMKFQGGKFNSLGRMDLNANTIDLDAEVIKSRGSMVMEGDTIAIEARDFIRSGGNLRIKAVTEDASPATVKVNASSITANGDVRITADEITLKTHAAPPFSTRPEQMIASDHGEIVFNAGLVDLYTPRIEALDSENGIVRFNPVRTDAVSKFATIVGNQDLTIDAGSFLMGKNARLTVFGNLDIATHQSLLNIGQHEFGILLGDINTLGNMTIAAKQGNQVNDLSSGVLAIRRRLKAPVDGEEDLGTDFVSGGRIDFFFGNLLRPDHKDNFQLSESNPDATFSPANGFIDLSVDIQDANSVFGTQFKILNLGNVIEIPVGLEQELRLGTTALDMRAQGPSETNPAESLTGRAPTESRPRIAARGVSLSQADEEKALRLNIYVRNWPTEIRDDEKTGLKTGNFSINDVEKQKRPGSMDPLFYMASIRLQQELLDPVLNESLDSLTYEIDAQGKPVFELDEHGAPRKDENGEDVKMRIQARQVFGDAWDEYDKSLTDDDARTPEGYWQFVLNQPQDSRVCVYASRLQNALRRLELLGQNRREFKASADYMISLVMPDGCKPAFELNVVQEWLMKTADQRVAQGK